MLTTNSICRSSLASAGAILIALCTSISPAQAQVFNTANTLYRIAGSANATPGTVDGADNGSGTDVRFNIPWGIAKSTAGDLYVADYSNHTIRRIAPDGDASTFAGVAGTPGHVDSGPLTPARFNSPLGLAFDALGNLYVAEYVNSTVRQITPAGVVTTIAGAPPAVLECLDAPTATDGPALDARFCTLAGIVADGAGNLYVADVGHHAIRKISGGAVTTLAGNGTCTPALCDPHGLTIDAEGENLYVTGYHSGAISRIPLASPGTRSIFAGGGGCGYVDSPGTAARFCNPTDIKADTAGNLYVADSGASVAGSNALIRKTEIDGAKVSTVVGTPGSTTTSPSLPVPLPGSISRPYGLAVIGSNQLAIAAVGHELLGANLGTGTFTFSGFFPPVDNPPTFNSVKAGSAIPVKFSLGGNQGLNIFASGYPKSQQINCSDSAPVDAIEETINPGSNSLSYDAASDRYNYVWKTNKTWAGTCRQLVVRFTEGTERTANFKFN